jgi:hypothetical protein
MILQRKANLQAAAADSSLPVTDTPPVSSRPLILTSSAPTNYPAAGAAAVVIFSYQVPRGQRARISQLALVALNGGQVDMQGNIIWRFTVNGAPLKGLGTQLSQIGTFSTPNPVTFWLTENDLFQITVEVAAGAPIQAGQTAARIAGWTEPLTKGDTTQ